MATGYGRNLEEKDLNISSMCTVFAESEVTSLIARGQSSRDIARGLHTRVIRKPAIPIILKPLSSKV